MALTIKQTLAKYPNSVCFKFGDSASLNAEIVALILAGRKTMTCDAVAAFEARGEAFPELGRVDIALDWSGEPIVALRTVSVEYVPFDQMDDARVALQGEFHDLAQWQAGYRAYLTRAGHFAHDVEMLVETFEIVEVFS